MADVLLAATRDASAVACPNTRTPKKAHVAIVEGELPATWWEEPELVANAACDPMTVPLDMTVASPADQIPESRRCRRPGCASRWPQYRARQDVGRG